VLEWLEQSVEQTNPYSITVAVQASSRFWRRMRPNPVIGIDIDPQAVESARPK